jgi:N utilization substance protein B
MKTSQDPRHQKRIDRIEDLFSYSFRAPKRTSFIEAIEPHLPAIDACLMAAAPEWPIDKLSKTDLAILRLAIWELTIEKNAPVKVIIDEAVELAKAYGNEHSAGFVNGALGAVTKTLSPSSKNGV